jgi:hypothetical protein
MILGLKKILNDENLKHQMVIQVSTSKNSKTATIDFNPNIIISYYITA